MVQNLQCDWLLRVHYNTTMHAVFVLSSVSWKTNVTKFSVVFTHKLLVKKCKKTPKTKLHLTRKYLNCHPNRNSLTYHRRNTKNIFHIFCKQKHNRSTKRSDCSTFLPKILCHMQQNSLKSLFVLFLPFSKFF